MELKLNGKGYKEVGIDNRRFDIVNSGKNQLTVEDATVFLSWAVDGDKIKAMLHGEISEQVFCAMLRTFAKDFPDMVRGAVVSYLTGCLFSSGMPMTDHAAIESGLADKLATVPDLKGGDGECKS